MGHLQPFPEYKVKLDWLVFPDMCDRLLHEGLRINGVALSEKFPEHLRQEIFDPKGRERRPGTTFTIDQSGGFYRCRVRNSWLSSKTFSLTVGLFIEYPKVKPAKIEEDHY